MADDIGLLQHAEYLRQINEPLLAWFEENKRDLPWRHNVNAYHVWVSEIMLQQTRVEAVKEYYRRFLSVLPDVEALANAKEDELLKLWEGLGYYNRVRNMQKAAKQIMQDYDGEFPADYEAILGLSGIGSYTAGAIASIAFQIAMPAVDGNVLRVVMRILECDSDILRQSVKREVEQLLKEIMPGKTPGSYNQALMELGAIVCVPNGAPKCEQCPVGRYCLASCHGTVENLPVREKKKKRRIEEKTVFVIVDGDNTVLRKRESKGLLAGLYEIPNTEGSLDEKHALEWVKKEGFQALHIEKLPDAKHIFSHVEWHMCSYLIKVYGTKQGNWESIGQSDKHSFLIVERRQIEKEYPIPSAFAYYRKYIESE